MGAVKRFSLVGRITSAQAIAAVNTDLVWNAILNEGPGSAVFAYDIATGIWTLPAGLTYRLFAHPHFGPFTTPASGTIGFTWVDAANNPLIANGGRGLNFAIDNTTATGVTPGPTAFLLYTPTAQTQVKVRITTLAGGPVDFARGDLAGGAGFAAVEQI